MKYGATLSGAGHFVPSDIMVNIEWFFAIGRAATACCWLALSGVGCREPSAAASEQQLTAEAPLPTDIPAGTRLVLGDPQIQLALRLSGEVERLPYRVEFQNLTGGPQTLEAFRAGAIDGGSVGDTPPIHAGFTGVDVKIVAVQVRRRPTFELATSPKSTVRTTAELRGKRIAYAPGQAQGALVLRVLKREGLRTSDVQLLEMNSSEFKDALAGEQVDVAPLSGPGLYRYLREYREQGAASFAPGVRDNLSFFYVRGEVLRDPARAAALRHYVALRARVQRWASEHAEEWVKAYYVEDQGLSLEAGRRVYQLARELEFPSDWSDVIAATQETIDLLAAASGRSSYGAERLFDRRFQTLASITETAPVSTEERRP